MQAHHPFSLMSIAARWRARAGEQSGFTLIEVLATALIVVVIAAGVAEGLSAGAHFSGSQQHRSQADELAQQDQERLRGLSAKQLGGLATAQSQTITLGTTTFTVSSQANLLSTSSSTSCTTAGAGAVAYYRTTSTVSWHELTGNQSVIENSIITPPAGGSLLVAVVDQTSNPLSGATAQAIGASGNDNESGTTDNNGCVIFSGLSVDNFTVKVSDPGYVDINGNSPLTDTATVTSTGTARPSNNTEMIGLAGTVNAAFSSVPYATNSSTTPASSALTGQAASDLGWYGSGSSVSMTTSGTVASPSPTGSTTLSAGNLFPFYYTGPPGSYTNNYHVWSGACRFEELPASTGMLTINPGLVAAATIPEPDLALSVKSRTGSYVVPNDVKLTYTSTSGTSCTDVVTPQVNSSASPTSTNGVLLSPGVPFASQSTSSNPSASGLTGQVVICADYGSYRGTTSAMSLTNLTAPTPVTLSTTSSGAC